MLWHKHAFPPYVKKGQLQLGNAITVYISPAVFVETSLEMCYSLLLWGMILILTMGVFFSIQSVKNTAVIFLKIL